MLDCCLNNRESFLRMKTILFAATLFFLACFAPPATGDNVDPQLSRLISGDHTASDEFVITLNESGEELVVVQILLEGAHELIEPDADGTVNIPQLMVDVAALQDTVIPRMSSRLQGLLRVRYQTFAGLTAGLSTSDIAEMAAIEGVALVAPIRPTENFFPESHPLTGVDLAHHDDENITGLGTVIAFIDTGIDVLHPSLGGSAYDVASGNGNGKVVAGYDVARIPPQFDPSIFDDASSHGTSVAAIAAGNDPDPLGMRGVAYEANIVMAKRDCDGDDEDDEAMFPAQVDCSRSNERVLLAIDWLNMNSPTSGVDVLSLSIGSVGQQYSSAAACALANPLMDIGLATTEAAGIITFAASGNSQQPDTMVAPACLDSVISVASAFDAPQPRPTIPGPCGVFPYPADGMVDVDMVDCRTNRADILDIFVPGKCATTANLTSSGGGLNTCFEGSSAAAPFAAGVAALLIEVAGKRTISTQQMRAILTDADMPIVIDYPNFLVPDADGKPDLNTIREKPRVDVTVALTKVRALGLVANSDADLLPDHKDNCQLLDNQDQRDTDGDGFGNPCDTDLNNDGITNAADLGLFRDTFFLQGDDLETDFDGDGVVNIADLSILREHFFQPPGPSGLARCGFASYCMN